MYYLQDNAGEINSERENLFPKLQQSWVNKYNSKGTWEMKNNKDNLEKDRQVEDECKFI